jgi:hypothetical protein
MKKLLTAVLFSLVVLSFGYAATSDTALVSASVKAQLDLTNVLEELDLEEIDTGEVKSGDVTFTVRSNHKSWKILASSTYGSKLTFGGTAAWASGDVDLGIYIPYTIALKNASDTVIADNSGNGFSLVTTSTANGTNNLIHSFTDKTTGGSAGQGFKFTVTTANGSAADYIKGFYQDTITISIAAN